MNSIAHTYLHTYTLCFSLLLLHEDAHGKEGREERGDEQDSRLVAGLGMSVIIINELPCPGRARRVIQCHAMCTKNSRGNVPAQKSNTAHTACIRTRDAIRM